MTTRVLIVSMDVPTQGGAATGSYALFAKMKRDGIDAHFMNIVERAVVPYYEWNYGADFGNPDGSPCVHTCVTDHPTYGLQPGLAEAIERIAPGVVFARGYIPALIVGNTSPNLPLVLSTAGSWQAEFLIRYGRVPQATDLSTLVPETCRLPTAIPGKEARAFDAADAIVTGSDLVRDTIRAFSCTEHRYKVHETPVWSAEWVVESVDASGVMPKPFESRSIDVLDIQPAELQATLTPMSTAGSYQLTITVPADCPRVIFNTDHKRGYVQVGDPQDKDYSNWFPLIGAVVTLAQ